MRPLSYGGITESLTKFGSCNIKIFSLEVLQATAKKYSRNHRNDDHSNLIISLVWQYEKYEENGLGVELNIFMQ